MASGLPFYLDNRRYKCVAELGGGNFGRVYLATDRHLGVRVAVKVFEPTVLFADVLREAQLQARLSDHPHVVRILNVRLAPPRPFMVMAYVPGGSVAGRQTAGGVSVQESVRWVRDALSGLAHAHRLGVIHRDIKPANLLLTTGDRVALGDFGIADDTIRGLVASQTYGVHAAPEMVAGGQSTAQTDVWAVGCTLHRLLTGHYPFVDPALIARGEFTDPHKTNPQVPLALTRVVQRSLAVDLAVRYRDAPAMQEAVSRLDVRASWRQVTSRGDVERWEARTARGTYVLTWQNRPQVGHEVTVRLDQGKGPRRIAGGRHPTEARARQARRTLLTRLVEAGAL